MGSCVSQPLTGNGQWGHRHYRLQTPAARSPILLKNASRSCESSDNRMDPLDHDSLWKTAIDPFPRSLLELTFPEVTGRIDGSAKPESLEQELQKLGPESKIGDRHVDKLLKVSLLDGPAGAAPPVGLRSPSRRFRRKRPTLCAIRAVRGHAIQPLQGYNLSDPISLGVAQCYLIRPRQGRPPGRAPISEPAASQPGAFGESALPYAPSEPSEATPSSPFRAITFRTSFPWALPRAISFGPAGAAPPGRAPISVPAALHLGAFGESALPSAPSEPAASQPGAFGQSALPNAGCRATRSGGRSTPLREGFPATCGRTRRGP